VGMSGGLLLIFAVTCGNVDTLGFIVGSQGTSGFILFSKPVMPDFIPGDMIGAFANVQNANGGMMVDIIGTNLGSSIAPYLQLLAWCFAFYIISYARPRKTYEDLNKLRNSWLYTSLSAAVIILLAFLVSYVALGYALTPWVLLVSLGIIPMVLAATAFSIILRWEFKDYFKKRVEITAGRSITGADQVEKTTFESVGGLSDIKEEVRDSILVPLLRRDIAEHYGVSLPKGILLIGPPGCGKTLLMRALASELRMDIIIIKCSDLMSKWYGESESRIELMFKEARERKPSIIFLDDIDTIARSRDLYSADDVTPRLLGMILSELDGMNTGSETIIVGSTNKPEIIDPAILRPGRIDKIIYVPPPDIRERAEILRIHLKGKPAEDVDIAKVAKKTEGFSGADLANLVNEAAVSAMKNAIRAGKRGRMATGDFAGALKSIKPSITSQMLEEYEKYKHRFERKILRGVKGEVKKTEGTDGKVTIE
ncbi:MAG: ATP-binding protein, partial [Thermoplasmata archaeon]|nr:ATP-binding protein [Thermoplasmata archaeon]